MNINGGFFSESESAALREMEGVVGYKMKRCVYPTTKNLTYYISEQGHLFSTQRIQGKVLVRGPKRPGTKGKGGRITHRMSNGRHGNGAESWVPAELLVYCTFTLGRWDPDLHIDFKNGDTSDLRPDNLREHMDDIPSEWPEQLTLYEGVYRENFKDVARRLVWWYGLCLEDAKDVAQSTFIWLCTDGYKEAMNVRLWIYWSKMRAYDFKKRHSIRYNFEDFDAILELQGTKPPTCEVDLIHIQRGDRRQRFLELWAQGHTPTEIAEMEGSTVTNVGSSVTRSIQFLQKYFKHDKEYFNRRKATDVR